jgi:WD40 repeat protein
VQFWDTRRDFNPQHLHSHISRVATVAFSPNGSQYVSGSFDTTLLRWDPQRSANIGIPLVGHMRLICHVVFSPDSSQIVSSSWDITLQVWNSETGTSICEPLVDHKNGPQQIIFSLDGKYIMSKSKSEVVVWESPDCFKGPVSRQANEMPVTLQDLEWSKISIQEQFVEISEDGWLGTTINIRVYWLPSHY